MNKPLTTCAVQFRGGVPSHVFVAAGHYQLAAMITERKGNGSGLPITEVLGCGRLDVFALDAAPSFVEAFRHNLPNTPVVCEAVSLAALTR